MPKAPPIPKHAKELHSMLTYILKLLVRPIVKYSYYKTSNVHANDASVVDPKSMAYKAVGGAILATS